VTCGIITDFLSAHIKNSDLINRDCIDFSEIKFTNADISDIYDVKEARYYVIIIIIILLFLSSYDALV